MLMSTFRSFRVSGPGAARVLPGDAVHACAFRSALKPQDVHRAWAAVLPHADLLVLWAVEAPSRSALRRFPPRVRTSEEKLWVGVSTLHSV